MRRSITFAPTAWDGISSMMVETSACQLHKVVAELLGIPQMGNRPALTQPYTFVHSFFDLDGTPVCDKCVAEGLLDGSIEIENPGDLMKSDCDAVKDALGRWGERPLEIFERALQAADFRGQLPELASRLLAAAEHKGLEQPTKAGVERQLEGAAVADGPAGSRSPEPDVRRFARRGARS